MNLPDRVKKIITTPKTEWGVINNETTSIQELLMKYVLPLAGIAAIATFIGYGLIGDSILGVKVSGINWGLYHAINILITAFLSVIICGYVFDMLAPSFNSEKNLTKSFQLAVFSFTPAWVGRFLYIYPVIAIVGGIFGLYSLYLLYTGIPVMKKTPQENHTSYFIVSLLVMIVVWIVLGMILGKIFMNIFGLTTPTVDLSNFKI